MVVDIPDVVTYTILVTIGSGVFGWRGGQISPSPIDFHRRPYNTLALPCERVKAFLTVCVRYGDNTSQNKAKRASWGL